MGCADESLAVGCGKSVPTATLISVPLTEITALPGPGDCTPPVDGDEPPTVAGELPPPEEDPEPEPPVASSESCCANGSLLANRLNDAS